MARAALGGRHYRIPNTEPGRGRKRAAWVEQLYHDLLDDVYHVRSCGVKFNGNLLLIVARALENESTSGLYGPTRREPKSDKLVEEHLNSKRVERFMLAKYIVPRL